MSTGESKNLTEQLEKDLRLTVSELSDTYEELSIIYKLSQSLTGQSIEEICNTLFNEVLATMEVKTAAVMLLNEENTRMYTAVCKGKWPSNHMMKKSNDVIWQAVKKNKPMVFCNIKDSPYKNPVAHFKAILVCPLVGKRKAVGAIVTGEKVSGEEFYSSDVKFLTAMASQAALAIENASLYKELQAFFLGTVMAFVKAIESRSRWTSGHSERVTEYSVAIAKEMGMDRDFIGRLKICGLLHDIGKIGTPVNILDKCGALTPKERKEVLQHPLTGCTILEDLKPFNDVIQGIRHHHERWNGRGAPERLRREKIPLMARIISVADAFDAMTSDRPYRKKMSIKAAVKEMISYSGRQFDPNIVKALLKTKGAHIH